MKRTTDPMVDIVHPEYGHANVPTSTFEKVWAHRGYRLRAEVEAELAEKAAEDEAKAVADAEKAAADSTPTPAPQPAPKAPVDVVKP